MNKNKYTLGLDIGISSVGWGLLAIDENDNPYKIIDAGVKIFSPGEVPKTGASKNKVRRQYRGAKRLIRRREFRIDCVRHLLNLNGYLGENMVSGLVSNVNDELTEIFNKILEKFYKNNKNTTPYHLKVEALDRKLNKDELSIILVHYAKHRGYKSNREDETGESDFGKVKSSISENKKIMEDKKYRTISEMLIKDEKFQERIRNESNNYKLSITREQYLDEINKVLNAQIKFGLITSEFKEDYLKIWSGQRHYAKGPGGNSKYGGDLIAKMTGVCKFDGKPRAPKYAASAEIFVELTKLINFRYKMEKSCDYNTLTPEQISLIIEAAKNQDSITYNKIFELIKIENGIVKGLIATNKEKAEAIEKFKKTIKTSEFEYNALSNDQRKIYNELKNNSINKRIFINLKGYSAIRKEFVKQFGSEIWQKEKDNYDLLDNIATILTNYKVDEDVIKAIQDYDIDEKYTELILSLPNFKDHNHLSIELIRKLNREMIKGKTYNEAMLTLGFDHTNAPDNLEKQDLLIPLNVDNEIKNQRVIRSLAQARGIINSIIKKYGMPYRINIETTKELAKSRDERKEITKKRDANFEANEKIKNDMVNLDLFESKEKISSKDVLKYKLWLEQLGKCAYTLKPIPFDILFNDNLVQIDHILPYSRTFDDTYYNKTLVLTEANQEKRNQTPYEWFGKTSKWSSYKDYIESLDIPRYKKDKYLLVNLTPEIEAEYRNQNLNDTKNITKYLTSYIKANLNVEKINSPSGAITAKLRNYWHLNNLTHSLESETYYKNSQEEKKNRENHLHHAMDALIIATVNDKIIQRVSNYERYKRYIDNRPISYIESYIRNNDAAKEINKFIDSEGKLNETSLKEYFNELKINEYLVSKKQNSVISLLPQPYPNFCEEAKIRVYEQNVKNLQDKLKAFKYTHLELENIAPIIPKFARDKISGKLHGETYYSLKKSTDSKLFKVSRISVDSPKFNKDKLDKIVEKTGGSSLVYETVKLWIGDKNGKEAFQENAGYPINPKTKNKIKKIKIEEPYDGKGHIIDDKIVDKENIQQIEVYTKENDEKLYFVAYDLLDLEQIKRGINISVDIYWGSSAQKENINYQDLKNSYSLYITLRKNYYVEIELKNGKKGHAYICGFTSGQLELKSALGDGKDLTGKDKLFNKEQERYRIYISTIKNVNIIKLNNLGKIE